MIPDNTSQVTDVGVRALARCCPLRVVVLSGANLITDGGVLALARGCPSIKEIYLSGCSQVSRAAVRYLVVSNTRDQTIYRRSWFYVSTQCATRWAKKVIVFFICSSTPNGYQNDNYVDILLALPTLKNVAVMHQCIIRRSERQFIYLMRCLSLRCGKLTFVTSSQFPCFSKDQ